MLEEAVQKYLKRVKTGADLEDMGVIPKTSSEHVALITRLRLEYIRDMILGSINDEMLGTWLPLAKEENKEEIDASEITEVADMRKYAEVGMRVIGIGEHDSEDLSNKLGTIRRAGSRSWGIEFDEPLVNGHDFKEKIEPPCTDKHGYFVGPEALRFVEGQKIEVPGEFVLESYATADKQLGHWVKFNADTNINFDGNEYNIPKDEVAKLTNYDAENKVIEFHTENSHGNNRKHFALNLSDISDVLEVSSLGQMMPKNKEAEVRKASLLEYFPNTILEEIRSQWIIMALLMGGDTLLYGPPGSGKSSVAEDITTIASKHQKTIFIVEGCQSQCNPYSLFDEHFAGVLDACPECKIQYDEGFRTSGFFNMPSSKDVAVTVAKYASARGIELTEGTVALQRMHLVGAKFPDLSDAKTLLLLMTAAGVKVKGMAELLQIETKKNNDFDPEGFSAGILERTNNGILVIDEMEKLRPATIDGLLSALNSNKVNPEQLRYGFPADALIIGTANDHSIIRNAINDRMLFIAVRYSKDFEVAHEITRSAYHKIRPESDAVVLPDPHTLSSFNLKDISMPVIIENAIDALFIKFAAEYQGEGKETITSSNRSKKNALDAARAKLALDQIFYADTPTHATEEYAILGVKYAFCTRVQGKNPGTDVKHKEELSTWVDENYSDLLHKEENVWWCSAYKRVAIMNTQIPGIKESFIEELILYEGEILNALDAFKEVRYSMANPTDVEAQQALLKYPLINYMFEKQVGFAEMEDKEVISVMSYMMNSRKSTDCKIGVEELDAHLEK